MGSSSACKSPSSGRGAAHRPLLLTTSALAFLAFLNATVLNVALPDLAAGFGADVGLLGWAVTAYVIALAAGLIAGGRLADAVGRRTVLWLGAALFALASVAAALAAGAAALIAARGVQGIAAALITPASFALLLAETPAERRNRAVGVWSSAAATSAFVGPPLGGLLVEGAGWRAPLLLSGALALALLGCIFKLPRPAQPHAPVPAIRGALLGGLAIAILALSVREAEEWGWAGPRTITGLAAAAIAIGVGVGAIGDGGASWRIVDRALFRRKAFAAANALSIAFGFAAFAWLLAAPLFVATAWRWEALAAALSVAPGAVAAALAALVAGRIPRSAHAWVVVLGAAALALSTLALIVAADRSPRFLSLWLPAGLLAGIGIGGALASLSATVAASVPERDFAQAAGINMTARQLGGTLGIATVTALLGAGGGSGPASFRAVWAAIAAAGFLTALGGAALLAARRRRQRSAGRRRAPAELRSSVSLQR